MRAVLSAILLILIPAALYCAGQEEADAMVDKLHWLGHASFRLDGPKTIYFDPWKLAKNSKKADIIFISHDHFDHCSLNDVKLVSTKDTVIVGNAASLDKLKPAVCKEAKTVKCGDKFEIDGVGVEVVPAYNIGKPYHARSAGMDGYLVTTGGAKIYYAGDTDLIPEMKDFHCDIAMLPVGGTYTMDADEAARAAIATKAKIAIPMHYGDIVGSPEDAASFRDALKGKVDVRILKSER